MKIVHSMVFKNNDEKLSFESHYNSFINEKLQHDTQNRTREQMEELYFNTFALKMWDWEKHCPIDRKK